MAECKELWNLRKRIQSQEFEVNFAKFNSISTWEETASYWRQELQSREKVVMALLLAEDRDAFTEFTRRVTDAMHALGFTVSVALAPKTARNQQGELYEGKDCAAIPYSAVRCISSVRICISNGCPFGPISVVCSD